MTKIEIESIGTDKLLEEISRRGFISQKRDLNIDRTYEWSKETSPFKIGIVSDCHIASQYQQLTLLREAYKHFKHEGITKVLNLGDITEGSGRMFRDQIYEMFIVGGDKIIEYTAKNYPKEQGITTYAIMGNHDSSLFVAGGFDPLKRLNELRQDIKYLGAFSAIIKIGGIRIQLLHPDGGGAYARSYKSQKITEQMSSDNKPNILLLGHFHSCNIMPQYRNVYVIQTPCFQSQTPFLKRKGLNPEVGYIILHITPNAKGISRIKVEYVPFYNIIQGDF